MRSRRRHVTQAPRSLALAQRRLLPEPPAATREPGLASRSGSGRSLRPQIPEQGVYSKDRLESSHSSDPVT